MATIRISDLKLQTIIGTNDWERDVKQDILINACIQINAKTAVKSDHIKDTLDYKSLTKEIIRIVENSRFQLLEKLVDTVLKNILKQKKVLSATVRIDKPQALRFAQSVSIEMSGKKK